MALKLTCDKPFQIVDLGTFSIKYGTFKFSKADNELVAIKKEVYKVPASYAGVEVYMEAFGQYLKDIAPNLDKKLPVCFSFSSLFAPTNFSYLTRVEKDKVNERMKEEIDKFAAQEKVPIEGDHNKYFEMFRKEADAKCQIISSSIVCNPKYIGIIRRHLQNYGLPFGGIYPLLQSTTFTYNRFLDVQPELKNEPIAMVDIGYLTTKVYLFFQEKLLFYKVLHYGTRNFYEELFDSCSKSGDTALSPQDVEALLQRVGFTGNLERANQMELDVNDLRPYLNQLDTTLKSIFSKVSSSVNYFISALARNFTADNNAFMDVRKGASHIFFSGGITNAPGFVDKIKESFSIKSYLVQPFDLKGSLERELKVGDNEWQISLRENSPFIDCLGAGLLDMGQNKKAYNLVSNIDSGGDNLLKILLALPLVKYRNVLIVILTLQLLVQVYKIIDVNSELKGLNQETTKLQNSMNDYKTLREGLHKAKQTANLNNAKRGYVQSHLGNYIYWPDLLRSRLQRISSSKIDNEIKVDSWAFLTKDPLFTAQKLKRWLDVKDQEVKDQSLNPWSPKVVEFTMNVSGLARTSATDLISVLTADRVFRVPEPPGVNFVPAQVIRKRGTKPGQEEEEMVAAHYTFTLKGTVQMDEML